MVLQYEIQRTIHCTYDGNLYLPRSIAFSPGGQYISAAMGTCLCVWNCDTGDKEYEVPYDTKALSVAWTHERQFIGGFADGMLLTASIDTEQDPNLTHTLAGFDPLNSPIEFIAVHHSHSSIAIGGDDVVQIWKPNDGYLKHVITIPPPPTASRGSHKVKVTSIGWVNHDTIIVSYLNNGILIWNVGSNGLLRPRSELPVRNQCPRGSVAPDGRHFVALNKTNTFHLYHIDSGIFLHSFRPENSAGSTLSHYPAVFVHYGAALLGASGSKIFLWDIKTLLGFHEPLSVPSGQLLQLAGECVASSNQFLIAGSTSTGQINIWKSHQVLAKNFTYKPETRDSQIPSKVWYYIAGAVIFVAFVGFLINRSRPLSSD